MNFSFIRGTAAEEQPKKPQISLLKAPLEEDVITIEADFKNRLKELTEGNNNTEQATGLKKLYAAEKAENKRTFAICKEYQDNTRAAGQLRTEILKGIKAAEDTTTLLLKACKAISLMTGDKLFSEQVEADLLSIYGAGLLQQKPLELEIKQTQNRLERLLQAEQRESQPDTKARITAAIKSHRARIAELESFINWKQQ